jgi:hypothetical protein
MTDYPRERRTRRSELERLLDNTVLDPTHPELGTCWRFTGTAHTAASPRPRTATPTGSAESSSVAQSQTARSSITDAACWNPDHLEPVTHAENQLHLRKTQCKHGHPLSGDNLRISPNGTRACRACNAATQRAFRERQRRNNA